MDHFISARKGTSAAANRVLNVTRTVACVLVALCVLSSAASSESLKLDSTFRLRSRTFTCPRVTSILEKCVYVIKPFAGGALIGSERGTASGATLSYLTLVDRKGKVSRSFRPHLDGAVTDLVVQTDGKIVIVGQFRNVDGIARGGIARLNADGSLDSSLDPGTGFGDTAPPIVQSTALSPDGSINLVGASPSYNEQGLRYNILRVSNTGSRDFAYASNIVQSFLTSRQVEFLDSSSAFNEDGSALVDGGSYDLSSQTYTRELLRLDSTGLTDSGFQLSGITLDGSSSRFWLTKETNFSVGTLFSQAHIRSDFARLYEDLFLIGANGAIVGTRKRFKNYLSGVTKTSETGAVVASVPIKSFGGEATLTSISVTPSGLRLGRKLSLGRKTGIDSLGSLGDGSLLVAIRFQEGTTSRRMRFARVVVR